MKVLGRTDSNTLLRTEVWTVVPEGIDRRFLVTVTVPENRPADKRVHGLIGVDGNGMAGTYFQVATYMQMEGLLPPAVTVSIGYPLDAGMYWGVARNQDLTPSLWDEWDATYSAIHQKPCPPTGDAAQFLRFINDELKPEIEEQYGVDPAEWTLAGHSLGGLFATFALLSDPLRFKRYLAVGSSFWWKTTPMFDLAEEFASRAESIDASVYLAAGELESAAKLEQAWARYLESPIWQDYLKVMGGIPDIVADTHRMADVLSRRPGLQVKSETLSNETHGTAVLTALSQGLRWLNAERSRPASESGE